MNTLQIRKPRLICLLAGLLVPAALLAQPGEGPGAGPGPKRQGPPPKRMLERFDADGDGMLSEAERETARKEHQARKAEMLKDYDADGDGTLSKQERAKVREELGPPPEQRKARQDKMKERFDEDGDGVLSEAEREKAREQMQKRKGDRPDRKGPPPPPPVE